MRIINTTGYGPFEKGKIYQATEEEKETTFIGQGWNGLEVKSFCYKTYNVYTSAGTINIDRKIFLTDFKVIGD